MKLSLLMSKKSLSAEIQKTLIYIRFKSSRLKFTYKPSIKLSSSLSQQRFQFNPYWQILVNSSRKFSETSVFQNCDTDGFLENSSSIFSKF